MTHRLLSFAVLAALSSCSRTESRSGDPVPQAELVPENPRSLAAAPAQHLLITAELADGGLRVVSAQRVDHPMPIDRAPELSPWRVRLEDAAGASLYVGAVDGALGVRGEHHGEDGQIEAHHLETPSSCVTLRTPVLPEARTLRLFARGGSVPPAAVSGKTAPPDAMIELGSAPLPEVRP